MTARYGVNLCFHGIGTPARPLEPGEAEFWITVDAFADILDAVRPRGDAWLSFDDGNASDVAHGLPALRDRGLRAAFFPIAGRLGLSGSLDVAGVRELADAGMTVGSHGMRHRPWRGLSRAELDEELVEARAVLQAAAGAPISAAACPLGSYDRRVLRRLRDLGYARVYTSDRAPAAGNAVVQPRFSVRAGDDGASVAAFLARRAPGTVVADRLRATVKRWR